MGLSDGKDGSWRQLGRKQVQKWKERESSSELRGDPALCGLVLEERADRAAVP